MAAVAVLVTMVVAPISVAQAAPPQATFAYGITSSSRLVLFNVNTPGTILRNVQVTGLQPGEDLLGIDARPATGELYGVGRTGRVYIVNPVTGVATAVGPPAFGPLGGLIEIGMDFNPVPDRIRVVTSDRVNLRLNPNNGTIAGADTALSYAAGDPNVGQVPVVTGAAYTNNVQGAETTTLYDIDTALDVLVTQAPPNSGLLNTVGPLGLTTNVAVGFDIATVGGLNTAYAALTPDPPGSSSNLYTIDLTSGAATLVGSIGGGEILFGLAVATGDLACSVPAGTAGVIFVAPGGAPTFGTAGADVICGTSGVDRIGGAGGDDLILGLAGDDQLTGGPGTDDIYGGVGNDKVSGAEGDDFLFGGSFADQLSGGDGNDTCRLSPLAAPPGPLTAGDQAFCETVVS